MARLLADGGGGHGRDVVLLRYPEVICAKRRRNVYYACTIFCCYEITHNNVKSFLNLPER